LSCNFAEMTASSPFMRTFLATNLQVINGIIDVRLGNVYETCFSTNHVRHTGYQIYVGFVI